MNSHRGMASLAFVSLAAIIVACSEGAAPAVSALEGLAPLSTSDTGTKKPTDPPAGVGSFHGVVRGYSTGVIDTLGTAVLLTGVTVNAYTRLSIPNNSEPCPACEVGPLAASVLTDANGVFQLPSLAGGNYVVTFAPAAGSAYQGGWTVSTANATSNQSPWWIMLPKK